MAKRFPPMALPEPIKKLRPDEGKGRGFEDLRPELQLLIDETLRKMGPYVRTDLDNCVYESLADFPNPVQDEIVRAFGRADLNTVRNKTGYFIGILKEYRRHGKALSQGAPADGGLPMPPRPERVKTGSVAGLPLGTQQRFRELFMGGQVMESELDGSIYDSLADFDERTQAAIIERFKNADFASLKNKTGYFISILKQARECRKNGIPFGTSGIIPQAGYTPPPTMYDSYGNYNFHPHPSFGAPPPAARPLVDPLHRMHPNPMGFTDQFYATERPPRHEYGGYGYGVSVPTPVVTGLVPDGVPQSFYKICPSAQGILADMYNSRILQPTDLEECVFDSLATFPDHEQCVICEGFSTADLARVRSRTAFFIGILKKHRVR